VTPPASLPRRLYRAWLELAARFGEAQTLVLLTLVYFLALGPAALGLAIGRQDPLHKRDLGANGSGWWEADTTHSPDLERARRLF